METKAMDTTRRRWLRGFTAGIFFAALACSRPAPSPSARSTPRRVVSLSPSTTEALFSVGAGHLLVGRSTFCNYPPEVIKLPTVGGYVDTNLEEVVHLAPDLVIGARGPAGQATKQKLESLGIATFFPPTQSIAEIEAMIPELADRVGTSAEGRSVVAAMRQRRADITKALASEPRVPTLFVFGLSPVVVAGPGSFPNEMIGFAGGANVVTSGGAYPALNAETLVRLDPDVIIDGAGAGAPERSIRATDPAWSELRAVRDGHVALLSDDAALRPGPRLSEGIATLARILHPHVTFP